MNWLNYAIDRLQHWYTSRREPKHPLRHPGHSDADNFAVDITLEQLRCTHDWRLIGVGVEARCTKCKLKTLLGTTQQAIDAMHDETLRVMAREMDASFYSYCQHEYQVGSPIDTVEFCPKCGHTRPCSAQWEQVGPNAWHQDLRIKGRESEWKREILGVFSEDNSARLWALAEDYHIQCAAFDEMACSGSRAGHAVPANQEEHARSNKHAYALQDDMYDKYVARLDVSKQQWRRAIADARPRRSHIEPSKPWPRK